MSIGKRRPRPSRAQLRPSAATISLKHDRQARQRTQAARLALVVASLLATAAIVHGSGPPFNYRLGERADREIRVNVKEFRIRNQTKTSNERQAAADQVPPAMVNDPAQILELADRLDDLTVDHRQGRPVRGRPRRRPLEPGSSGPRSSPRSSRPSPRPPIATQLHAQIAAAVPAARPRRHPRRRHPAAQRGIEPARCRSAQKGEPQDLARAGRARARHPRAHGQARRGRSTRNSAAPSARRRIGAGPLRADRRQVRRHADARLRGRGHRRGPRGRPGRSSPTITTPSPAARCSSSRARPSARSN